MRLSPRSNRALLSGEQGVPAVVASDYTLPKGQLGGLAGYGN